MADPLLQETVRASPFFELDRYARLSLAFYLLLMIVRFGVLDPASQTFFDTYLAEPFLLGTLVIMLSRQIYRSKEASFRFFYAIVLTGFAAWLSVSLLHIGDTDLQSTNIQLLRDLLFMLFSAAIVVAIELRLDTFHTEYWFRRRSLHALGGFLLVYTAFSYFAIVPLYSDSVGYNTPYALYAAVDLFLAMRFFTAVAQVKDNTWRLTYALFGIIFLLIVVADVLAFAYRNALLDYEPNSLANLVWYLWYPLAYAAFSRLPVQSAQSSQQTDSQVLDSATGGLLVFGLALPLIHVTGYGMSFFDNHLRDARDILVGVWIVLITMLFSGVYYFVTRHISKLDRERELAEDKASKLENLLEREVRLRLLGRLSAGLAHDFGNSLFAISTHAKAVEDRHNNGTPLEKSLAGLKQAIRYAQELVTKLSLAGAADTTASAIVFDICSEVEQAIQVLAPTLGADIKLHYLPRPEPILVRAERSMVQQVLTNYVYNAVDAIEGRGHIDISINTYPVRSHCSSCGDEVSGEYAVLTVKDDGPGIDAAVIDNIFEPLITTKPLGKGSGLGLAMIHAIMHRINGHVGIRSTPQQGTSFSAYFPIQRRL